MLAILTSHPIQYQVPLWRALATDGRVPFEVWFLTPHAVKPSHDQQFGRTFAWDSDLLGGYPNRFVPIAEGWQMNKFSGVAVTVSWEQQFRTHQITKLWVEGWRFREFWSAIRTAHRLGITVLMRGENNDLAPSTGPIRWVKKQILRYLFGKVDAFLTIGSANKRFYRNHGIADHRLHPAPYAVDNARWRTQIDQLTPQRAEIREAYHIPPDAYCLLFCGKLIDKKRPLDIPRASRRIAHSGKSLFLLFAGDGALRTELEVELSQPSTPAGTLLGFMNLSDIARAFVAADALVLPSDSGETWGLVVNEAMACGLPVVVSDKCGCAEDLVATMDTESVFKCGDILDLTRAINHLLISPPSVRTIQASVNRHDIGQTVQMAAHLCALPPTPE